MAEAIPFSLAPTAHGAPNQFVNGKDFATVVGRQGQLHGLAIGSRSSGVALRECILEGRGTRRMDVIREIASQVEKLPSDMQEQVLRFVVSLSTSMPAGENGAHLRQFSSSLDSVSAQQMRQAINEECERVDASEW
jgi:hypothetical protein